MRELLEQIAKALVDDPDAVHVLETEHDSVCVLTLRVAKADLGKLIGKRGAHAQAMRTLLAAAGGKLDKRYTLEIADE